MITFIIFVIKICPLFIITIITGRTLGKTGVKNGVDRERR